MPAPEALQTELRPNLDYPGRKREEPGEGFDSYMTKFYPPNQPYTLELARHDLIEEARSAGDPLVFFLERECGLTDIVSGDVAMAAFSEDLHSPDSFWRPVLQKLIDKPEKDLVDLYVLAELTGAVLRHWDKDVPIRPPKWLGDYIQSLDPNTLLVQRMPFNFGILHAGVTDMNTLRQLYQDADTLSTVVGLSEEAHLELRRKVSQTLVLTFIGEHAPGTGGDWTLRVPITGLCHENGRRHREDRARNMIDVTGWTFIQLTEMMPTAIEEIAQGSPERRTQIIEQLVFHLMGEISSELVLLEHRHSTNLYDAQLRAQVIYFLERIGLSWEQRRAVYKRIPGFIALPDQGQQIITEGGALEIVEEELTNRPETE